MPLRPPAFLRLRLLSGCLIFSFAGLPLSAQTDGAEAPASEVTGAALNDAAGALFWLPAQEGATSGLWDESANAVAQRLKLPKESKTSTQSSYRLYPKPDFRLFGTRPYSVALYAKGDKATEFSIVFANGGDYFTDKENLADYHSPSDAPKIIDAFKKQLRSDEDAIRTKLTSVLGAATESHVTIGNNEYSVARWTWRDCYLMLARPQDKCVLLRIVPVKQAETDRIGWQDRKEQLAQRIIRRENGDVVIGEIPMVDQGPKGYCVPATWERYLRYLDIPADMYVLAQFGGTMLGGGTDPAAMATAADLLAQENDLRIDTETRPLIFDRIRDSIDRGLPFMWGCRADPGTIDKWITNWTAQRKKSSWDDWTVFVKARPPVHQPIGGDGHMRMIVGYNKETREVAISDSWGEKYAERWLPFDVLEELSQGMFYTIRW